MKLILAAVAFVVTLSALFLFNGHKIPKPQTDNAAQIIQALKSYSPTKTPIKNKQVTKGAKPDRSPSIQISPTITETPKPSPNPTFSNLTTTSPTSSPTPTVTVINTQSTHSPTPTFTPTPTPTLSSTPIPTLIPSSSSTGETLAIQVLSSLPLIFKQKQDAEIKIQTSLQAQCSIKVTLPSGSVSGNNELVTKMTDGSGYIKWTWSINWNTKTGTGKIDISCIKDLQNISRSLEMTITQ